MSRFLQLHSRRRRRSSLSRASALLASVYLAAAWGCGEVTCPEELSNVDGVCEKVDSDPLGNEPEPTRSDERCDGMDNDGDDAVDEDWPELGEACGEGGGRGECVLGEYVCAPGGMGVVCEGAQGPTDEVCDGKDNDCDGIEDNGPEEICDAEDNDCDGLVDEGVWSMKQERFDDHATVAAVDGGFVVTRAIADQLRVETYDNEGTRTGHHDDIDNPSAQNAFLESDAAGGRVVVGLGQHQFHVLEAQVDSELVPIILGVQELHEGWDQGIDWGIYEPPYHPRVSASPARFVGHQDLITFALSPFAQDHLRDLAEAPIAAAGLPYHAYFDAVGAFVVWEQADNVRAGWLQDDGALFLDIDVARGRKPAIGAGSNGPGVAFLQSGKLLLSELAGLTLQCRPQGFCRAEVKADPIEEQGATAMGLAFDEATDTWVIAAGEQLLVVGRGEHGPVVKQAHASGVGAEPPTRLDVVVSGGTAAIVQTADNGDSALTFMGCF